MRLTRDEARRIAKERQKEIHKAEKEALKKWRQEKKKNPPKKK